VGGAVLDNHAAWFSRRPRGSRFLPFLLGRFFGCGGAGGEGQDRRGRRDEGGWESDGNFVPTVDHGNEVGGLVSQVVWADFFFVAPFDLDEELLKASFQTEHKFCSKLSFALEAVVEDDVHAPPPLGLEDIGKPFCCNGTRSQEELEHVQCRLELDTHIVVIASRKEGLF
jgi:hypothetical protein